MEKKICPESGDLMMLRPAGISKKTGKPYSAFWSCTNRECSHTENAEVPVVNPELISQAREKAFGRAPSTERTTVFSDPFKVEEDKQLRIAREACISSVARILSSGKIPLNVGDLEYPSLDEVVDELMNQADKLCYYVYNGLPEPDVE